jgi:hypothetical protein
MGRTKLYSFLYKTCFRGIIRLLVEKKINEVLKRHGAEAMKALGLHKTLSLSSL